jgi:hypothetical protein
MSKSIRKKTYVDPKIQGMLVRRLVIHWTTFLIVASGVVFCVQLLSDPFRPLGEHFQQLWWMQGPFLLVFVLLLPVFVLDTIKLSHRFVGPVYRLRQTIRQIAEGNTPPPLKFRDFDFWQDMAQDFNVMVDRLSDRKSDSEDEDLAETAEPVQAHERS